MTTLFVSKAMDSCFEGDSVRDIGLEDVGSLIEGTNKGIESRAEIA